MGGFFSADASDEKKFAKRAAGTYFVQFDLGNGLVLPAVATIHEDGTSISVDATDESLGGLLFVNSPIMSNWKRTGRRTTVSKGIFLDFDPGSALVNGISKTTTVIHFDRHFREIHGLVCEQDIFFPPGEFDPGQHDPRDLPDIECTAETPGVVIFPFTGKRIR